MMNILEVKKCIKTESDLILYKFLCDNLENVELKKENKFIATQIYDSTMRYFYEYSEDDTLIKKALNRLLNIDSESFAAISVMSIYYKLLKSEDNKILIDDSSIIGSKASNKTIKYLMNKTGYYDYILYMLALGENIGISDEFIEVMIDYFNDNECVIKDELKLIDIFNNKGLMLDNYISRSKAI